MNISWLQYNQILTVLLLVFTRCGNIVGARLQVYLLEKSRVVTLGKSDKPYHIFSQMLRGSTEAEKTEWLLSDIIKNQGKFFVCIVSLSFISFLVLIYFYLNSQQYV